MLPSSISQHCELLDPQGAFDSLKTVECVSSSMLCSLSAFKRVYGTVIARSQDRSASDEERALGAARSKYANLKLYSCQIFCNFLEQTIRRRMEP